MTGAPQTPEDGSRNYHDSLRELFIYLFLSHYHNSKIACTLSLETSRSSNLLSVEQIGNKAKQYPLAGVVLLYFATATASSNLTESNLETPSIPIVTP